MKYAFVFLAVFLISLIAKPSDNHLSTKEALEKYGNRLNERKFLAYPELRETPIKWFDSIPERKIESTLSSSVFQMSADGGEYYVWQIGIWAVQEDLREVKVLFSEFKGEKENLTIPVSKMTCFNTGGINYHGEAFNKSVSISNGRVQALWLGIDLEGVASGTYTGSVSVLAGGEKQLIPVCLSVSENIVPNRGYNDDKKLSRLDWLNSRIAIDEEVTKGFTPVQLEENKLSILGRSVSLGKNGLPASMISYFNSSNQALIKKGEQIINHPFRFCIEKDNGHIIRLKPGILEYLGKTSSRISWKVMNTSLECDLEVFGTMEFDGYMEYQLKLTAKVPFSVKDIRLEVPMELENSRYMMGMGHEGGYRTPDFRWTWDRAKHQDMLWVGGVNGGMRIRLKAENYVTPLINIYYEYHPLNLPPSWGNQGNGGLNVVQNENDVCLTAYSGQRDLKKGEVLNYNFDLLITPLKLIDPQLKYGERYFHGGGADCFLKPGKAMLAGANILNIHHSEEVNPFINYPYLNENKEGIKRLAAMAHRENIRLKLYYTTRELTTKLPELWAFNSLNGEIFFPGPGNDTRTHDIYPNGPDEWYIKNMREKYIPGWFTKIGQGYFKDEVDLSLITTPDSRLNNFYLAGLDWMVRNLNIDGVYIDDTALDRVAFQRARKVLDRNLPDGSIDMHMWNHYRQSAGYASCYNLYMDLLPYIDLAWVGEGRNYDRSPDHWLIEVSGMPFGITGQMLHRGGNAWRGLVYGITNRAGHLGVPPTSTWKFWDDHRIKEKTLIGYWENDCPVKSSKPVVVASVYQSADELIIPVANWTSQDTEVKLSVNWKKLGFNKRHVEISIPEIDEIQVGQTQASLDKLVIPGGKGLVILVRKKD
jgi:hypothetical protein